VHTSLLQGLGIYDTFNWFNIQFGKPTVSSGASHGYVVGRSKDGYWIQLANAGRRQFLAFLDVVGLRDAFEAAGALGGRLSNARPGSAEDLWDLLLHKIGEKTREEWV